MPATGRCLCGAVRYDVDGPLRDIVVCHCVECLRWHGAPCPATAVAREHLMLREDGALRWIDSPESDAHARRGFCGECGSSMFWDAPGRDTVSIAAGSVDPPTGMRVMRHIYTAQAPDWDRIDRGRG
jgi:hypothetical protein